MAANGTYATKEEKEKFVSDEFCQMYNKLLSSKRLKETLEKYDYILVFYPHYCVQPFLECFQDAKRTERVILASNKDYDVQRLLIESDMLITDFSSVFFDYGYIGKTYDFLSVLTKSHSDNSIMKKVILTMNVTVSVKFCMMKMTL